MRTDYTAQGAPNALWWPKWEGNPKPEGIYVTVWLTDSTVQQKLTQHCTATILIKNFKIYSDQIGVSHYFKKKKKKLTFS